MKKSLLERLLVPDAGPAMVTMQAMQDALEIACTIIDDKKRQLDTANSLLLDMLTQYCPGGAGEIDTRCVSAAENACEHLLRAGLLEDGGNPVGKYGKVMRSYRVKDVDG